MNRSIRNSRIPHTHPGGRHALNSKLYYNGVPMIAPWNGECMGSYLRKGSTWISHSDKLPRYYVGYLKLIAASPSAQASELGRTVVSNDEGSRNPSDRTQKPLCRWTVVLALFYINKIITQPPGPGSGHSISTFRSRGTSDNDSFFTPHNISGGGRLSQSLDILLEHIVAGGRAWW